MIVGVIVVAPWHGGAGPGVPVRADVPICISPSISGYCYLYAHGISKRVWQDLQHLHYVGT
jgi:hypothetical protein